MSDKKIESGKYKIDMTVVIFIMRERQDVWPSAMVQKSDANKVQEDKT